MLTLRQLALKCEIKNYDFILWLQASELKGDVLVVPDKTHQSFITNCWLPLMREHVPGLQILVQAQPAREKAVAQRQGIWKAGREPVKTRLGGME